MSTIDAILYINLAHRTDRNDHILTEISKISTFTHNNIHRIDAIHRKPGALGCGLSHIKALEYALSHPEWNKVLILEDDFTFKSSYTKEELQNNIDKLLSFDDLNVGLLSYNHVNNFKYSDTHDDIVKKVLYAQTTSSYIITRQYIPILLENMITSTTDMEKNGKRHTNCLDIYWTKLQPSANWYALFPAIGYQYDNYSDIEYKFTSYRC